MKNNGIKILVKSWFDNFKMENLKKGNTHDYDVCSEDIEETFTDLEEATKFYNSIEEEISSNKYNVYVRSKIMSYVDEEGNKVNENGKLDDLANICENYDMGLEEFIKNL